MERIELKQEDWNFLNKIKLDVLDLIKENNKLKNRLESEEKRHLESEATYHAAILGVCREIERKVPGIDLDMIRFELET